MPNRNKMAGFDFGGQKSWTFLNFQQLLSDHVFTVCQELEENYGGH